MWKNLLNQEIEPRALISRPRMLGVLLQLARASDSVCHGSDKGSRIIGAAVEVGHDPLEFAFELMPISKASIVAQMKPKPKFEAGIANRDHESVACSISADFVKHLRATISFVLTVDNDPTFPASA